MGRVSVDTEKKESVDFVKQLTNHILTVRTFDLTASDEDNIWDLLAKSYVAEYVSPNAVRDSSIVKLFRRRIQEKWKTLRNRLERGVPERKPKYSKKGKLIRPGVQAVAPVPVYVCYPENGAKKIMCITLDPEYTVDYGVVRSLDYVRATKNQRDQTRASVKHVAVAHPEQLVPFLLDSMATPVDEGKKQARLHVTGLLAEIEAIDARRMRERAREFPMLTAIPATQDCRMDIHEVDVLYGDIGTDAGWATPPTEERM